MKPTAVLALSFLLSIVAFLTNLPLAFSDGEQVVDINGNPISPGLAYYIVPAIRGPGGGGLKLGQTGNSPCALTVLQEPFDIFRGIPVKFTIPGVSPGIIFNGTELEIEFVKKPECSESSKWLVFVDQAILKACVGVGGAEGHPGHQILGGKFHIEKLHGITHKLVFCITGLPTCLNIGRFNAQNGEVGKRLSLNEDEPFVLVFVKAFEADKVIKSVA